MNAHTDYHILTINRRGIQHIDVATIRKLIVALDHTSIRRAVITHPDWVGAIRVQADSRPTLIGWKDSVPQNALTIVDALTN